MSLFYLIRHGEHDWLKKGIAGRIPGESLNSEGRAQVEKLVGRLAGVKFDAIYTSPMERAIESAEPLANALRMKAVITPELTELDFGEWNGATFEVLRADKRWAEWNRDRSVVRMPGGEAMPEVQSRVVTFLMRLHDEKPNGAFALFSHGDSIRAALCYWMGMPLDLLPRLTLETASISILALDERGPRLIGLNHVR